MGQVNITINGRQYAIACDDGQEGHLGRLSRYIDQRAKELVAAVGQISESLLLVMICLLIADELGESNSEIEKLKSQTGTPTSSFDEKELANFMNHIAERISSIAERLEKQ